MKKHLIFIYSICFLAAPAFVAKAQPETSNYRTSSRYGFHASFNANDHLSNLRQLNTFADTVPRLGDGINNGWSIGGFYQIPISRKLFLHLEGLYNYDNATISGSLPTDYTITNFAEHNISANISSLSLETLLKYKFVGNLSLITGFSTGLRLASNYTDVIHDTSVVPEKVTTNFVKTSVTGLKWTITGGISYDIDFGTDHFFYFSPQLLYTFGWSDINKNYWWDVNAVRMGFSISFSTGSKIPVIEQPPPIIQEKPKEEKIVRQEVQPPKPDNIKVTVTGIRNKAEKPLEVLRIDEYTSTNNPPLLNYIFFDHNSSDLPQRYVRLRREETGSFFIESLFGASNLESYHQILNIVGLRMKANENAILTLTGCNSGMDDEINNKKLSDSRAMNVKNYLVNIWGIESERVVVKSTNLPDKPSKNSTDDGIAENRRVEMTSNIPDILAPIYLKSVYKEMDPETIRINIKSDVQNIAKWKIGFYSGGKFLKEISDSGTVPSFIDWNIYSEKVKIDDKYKTIDYQIELYDNNNKLLDKYRNDIDYKVFSHLNEKLVKGNKKVDNYSLILFDFDSYNLNSANQEIVSYINERIAANSKIIISGYTDRIGDDYYNMALSEKRAYEVSKAIKGNNKSESGYGKTILLYDNDLPEGRFYNRSVEVRVETILED